VTELLRDIRTSWSGDRRIDRISYLVGFLLVLCGLGHLGVQAVLGGPWLGPVSWRKPVTFGLSFGLTVVSVTWAASFLRIGARVRTALSAAFLGASVTEVVLISVQAWRGVPSHFNFETGFDVAVTVVLAAGGGVLLIVLGAAFGYSLRSQPDLEPTLRLGIRLGFGALMVALVSGAMMIALGTSLVRNGDPQAAYHSAGMFKPVHALAMHGIAYLPGLAWLGRHAGLPDDRWQRLWRIAAAGYLGLIGASFTLGSPGVVAWLAVLCLAGLSAAGALPIVVRVLCRRSSSD
jgi:hypothetical protein